MFDFLHRSRTFFEFHARKAHQEKSAFDPASSEVDVLKLIALLP